MDRTRRCGRIATLRQVATRLVLFLLLLTTTACRVVDSKVWNLDQLHDAEGRHKYSGALEGNMEFFLRHVVAASFRKTGASIADKSPARIDDPAGECVANLVDLESYDSTDPRISGKQVEWFARLAIEDPWKLSRERSVYALGRAGARLDAGVPVKLEGKAATADEVGPALEALIRSVQSSLTRGGRPTAAEQSELAAACRAVEQLNLDIEGGRRALRIASELSNTTGLYSQSAKPLLHLDLDLQRKLVRLGLAAALLDSEPLVRASAVEAAVVCAGKSVLGPVLAHQHAA